MKFSHQSRERKRKGSALVEVAIGFAVLMIVSLMLLKLSMIAIANRSWIVRQTLSDAYCTRESALAKRTPFANLNALWPTGAGNAAVTYPVMGTLGVTAGNDAQRTVTGTLKRYKTQIAATLPAGVGDASDPLQPNPAANTSYLLTSVLSYKIGTKQYYKTRSTVRTQ